MLVVGESRAILALVVLLNRIYCFSSSTKGVFKCFSNTTNAQGELAECLDLFFYQGQLYYGCSPVDGVWRCSITNSAEQKTEQLVACDQSCIDELARPCHTTLNVLADGTETGSSTCVFPFTYHGRTYHSCTNAGHDEYWCVTNDAPNDWAWGPCEVSCPKFGWRDPETQCRSIDHKVCQFPFIYEDQLYESCTFEDHEKPWCPYVLNNLGSVTEYWGICEQSCPGSQCLSEGLGPCVFPFGYQGQTHYTCTTVDHNVPWCSIENDPDGNILVFAQCEDTLACSMSFNLPGSRERAKTFLRSDKSFSHSMSIFCL